MFVLFGLSDCISRAEYLIANQEIRVRFRAVANMPRASLRRRVSKTHQAQGGTEAACHFNPPMVELEDTLVLETSAFVREGANPSRRTTFATVPSVATGALL